MRSTHDQRALALQAASVLLGYPDEELVARLPALLEAADRLPVEAADHVRRLVAHVASGDLLVLQRDYVDTFDLRRRCSPYLTYYAHGDTRKRGMALLRFQQAYRAAGMEPLGDELPDHLAVVCEFAALGDLVAGLALLAEQRAGVELLRMALAELGSPYLHAVDLVRLALPDPAPRDLERALELARSGPPAEEVGLEPFAPPVQLGARR